MGLDFTAVDLETANEQRASVCAVGIARVRGGYLVDSTSWLVSPPTGERFTNTHIHGIAWEQARAGATWAHSIATLKTWVGTHPVVAYNAPFDMSVFESACEHTGVETPDMVWVDTLDAARRAVRLESYALPHVASHLGIELSAHHHAEADARACAAVALALAQHARIGAGAPKSDASTNALHTPARSGTAHPYANSTTPLPHPSPTADPSHVLYGASITFTGDLSSYTRDEARKAAAACGARVTASPTKQTRFVVVGDFEPESLRTDAIMSKKLERAYDLHLAGQYIEFLTESEFAALLGGADTRGAQL